MGGFSFILCADDYGMTPAVSAGILAAARAGAVSAASAMVNTPDWPRAAAAWRAAAPDADLGLHVNLTVGAPLTEIGAYGADGKFPPLGEALRLSLARRADVAALAREVAAQCAAFMREMGRPPDHVDGHQHVQVLPGFREAFFEGLTAAGLTGVVVRDSADRAWRIAGRRAMAKKAFQVAGLAAGFGGAARRRGFVVNDGFAGFSDFRLEGYDALFASYMRAPGGRHLVMCHPGYVDDELRALDPVTASRESELAFLLSPGFRAALAAAGANLARASRNGLVTGL